ncbi:TPA: hypothetical protein ACH3X2_007055 [Trebouxia sp. C0005]
MSCKHLDDVLTYLGASDSVSLTDMLLMAGDASPTPGFCMLVQYAATLCHLHAIPVVQLQFKMYNQQALDVSQAQVLVYGHKTMLVQLGVEDAVYKIAHKLIQNELMIHNQVDATVPFIVKSHLGVFGSVEGAGAGWGFLKLQHLGCSLQAVSLNKLPRFWSCAVQVH